MAEAGKKRVRIARFPDFRPLTRGGTDATKPKAKPKPPTWATSEFAGPQASPSKPLAAQHPPPRPKDRSTFHTANGAPNSLLSPHPTPDPKVKKQTLHTSFSAQPAPNFAMPKTPQTDPQIRMDDSKSLATQVPAFRTNITRATPFGLAAPKDAALMPPPRIELKPPGPVLGSLVQDNKDYVPLTNLVPPRLFGPVSGKGRVRVASGDELPILDDPFIDKPSACPTIAIEDIESDAEAFTMRELARGLDFSPSKKDRSARQEPNKFIKSVPFQRNEIPNRLPPLRGGLAARAHVLITQRKKDDALWHHHKTSKLTNNPNLHEDLRVNVVERLQSIGKSVLARCVVCPADATRSKAALVDNEKGSVRFEEPSLVNVLLSQPGSRVVAGVESGTIVRLWKPWIEINLDAAPRALLALDGEHVDARPQPRCDEGDYANDKKEENPLLCSDGQDPGSYSENLAPDLRPRRALLCSRFILG
ncbi:hypothetical protein FRC06_009286 [Ceratobasidium sp. 370]|nr:hypothetical protein FRC06_009286 [Ceratobasidium sp. 370]